MIDNYLFIGYHRKKHQFFQCKLDDNMELIISEMFGVKFKILHMLNVGNINILQSISANGIAYIESFLSGNTNISVDKFDYNAKIQNIFQNFLILSKFGTLMPLCVTNSLLSMFCMG